MVFTFASYIDYEIPGLTSLIKTDKIVKAGPKTLILNIPSKRDID